MNGVDRSDQLLAKNNAFHTCKRWWKVLFYHMIDIAVVNSFILFQLHRNENPGNELLKRPAKFSICEFREELVRQLAGLDAYGQPPVHKPPKPPTRTRGSLQCISHQSQPTRIREPGQFHTVHIPQHTEQKRNCRVCYSRTKKELKVRSYCGAPQCQTYLHCQNGFNCFRVPHQIFNFTPRKSTTISLRTTMLTWLKRPVQGFHATLVIMRL